MKRVLIDLVDNASAGWLATMTHVRGGPGGEDLPLCKDVTIGSVDITLRLNAVQEVTVKVPAPSTLSVAELAEMLEWMTQGTGQAPVWVEPWTYGTWLHQALFASHDAGLWPAIEAIGVQGNGVELALRWAPNDTNLHRLLWEAMYAPPLPTAPAGAPFEALAGFSQGRPLVAITRLVTPLKPLVVPLPFTGIPKVLFAMGSTFDDEKVRPGAMLLGLLRSFDAQGLCVSRVKIDLDLKGLAEVCTRFQPQVINIVAHGTMNQTSGEVTIALGEDDHPGYQELLASVGNPVALFLSVCDTGRAGALQAPLAARLVEGGIPVVAAMAGRVGVSACRLFIRKLVEAIAGGQGLVEASALGRRAALLAAQPAGAGRVDLDWALPTLFLSDTVEPDNVLDISAAAMASAMTKQLHLPRPPPFVGRDSILQTADEMLNPNVADAARIPFLAITNPDNLLGLGGTTLLREIACRMIRAGHVPILMAIEPGSTSPTTFAQLVADLFRTIGGVRKAFQLPLRWPSLLGPAPAAFDRDAIKVALAAYRAGPDRDPDDVRDLLVVEIEQLLIEVRTQPPPFGPHSGVAVLGDEVQQWGALETLLGMVGLGGLGSWAPQKSGLPIPLVVTAVMSGFGDSLKETIARLQATNGKFEELGVFTPDEAIAAYNWTLLQSWQRSAAVNGGGPPRVDVSDVIGQAFVVVDDEASKKWEKVLMDTLAPHWPSFLTSELYLRVKMALAAEWIRRIDEDDDQAINSYDEWQP